MRFLRVLALTAIAVLAIAPSSEGACIGDYCEIAVVYEIECAGTWACESRRGSYRYHRCVLCGRPALGLQVVCC
jgi:hypothetical protein